MRNLCFIALMMIIFCSTAVPAHADIDQLCLRRCVADTGNKTACLTQCSYALLPPKTTTPAALSAPSTQHHNVLQAPTPVANNTIIVKKAKPLVPEKDWACFSQCLKNGNAYSLCEQKCVKAACPPNAVMCVNAAKNYNDTSAQQ